MTPKNGSLGSSKSLWGVLKGYTSQVRIADETNVYVPGAVWPAPQVIYPR